jgi:hypothetical protein
MGTLRPSPVISRHVTKPSDDIVLYQPSFGPLQLDEATCRPRSVPVPNIAYVTEEIVRKAQARETC